MLGEIYISHDRIKANSKKYSVSFRQELLRVMFHGALHLCGYKDKKKKDTEMMRFKEHEYLNLFNDKKLRKLVSRETF